MPLQLNTIEEYDFVHGFHRNFVTGKYIAIQPHDLGRPLTHAEMDYNLILNEQTQAGFRIFGSNPDLTLSDDDLGSSLVFHKISADDDDFARYQSKGYSVDQYIWILDCCAPKFDCDLFVVDSICSFIVQSVTATPEDPCINFVVDSICGNFDIDSVSSQDSGGTSPGAVFFNFASNVFGNDRFIFTPQTPFADVAYTIVGDGNSTPVGPANFINNHLSGTMQSISGTNDPTVFTGIYRFTPLVSSAQIINGQAEVNASVGGYNITAGWYYSLQPANGGAKGFVTPTPSSSEAVPTPTPSSSEEVLQNPTPTPSSSEEVLQNPTPTASEQPNVLPTPTPSSSTEPQPRYNAITDTTEDNLARVGTTFAFTIETSNVRQGTTGTFKFLEGSPEDGYTERIGGIEGEPFQGEPGTFTIDANGVGSIFLKVQKDSGNVEIQLIMLDDEGNVTRELVSDRIKLASGDEVPTPTPTPSTSEEPQLLSQLVYVKEFSFNGSWWANESYAPHNPDWGGSPNPYAGQVYEQYYDNIPNNPVGFNFTNEQKENGLFYGNEPTEGPNGFKIQTITDLAYSRQQDPNTVDYPLDIDAYFYGLSYNGAGIGQVEVGTQLLDANGDTTDYPNHMMNQAVPGTGAILVSQVQGGPSAPNELPQGNFIDEIKDMQDNATSLKYVAFVNWIVTEVQDVSPSTNVVYPMLGYDDYQAWLQVVGVWEANNPDCEENVDNYTGQAGNWFQDKVDGYPNVSGLNPLLSNAHGKRYILKLIRDNIQPLDAALLEEFRISQGCPMSGPNTNTPNNNDRYQMTVTPQTAEESEAGNIYMQFAIQAINSYTPAPGTTVGYTITGDWSEGDIQVMGVNIGDANNISSPVPNVTVINPYSNVFKIGSQGEAQLRTAAIRVYAANDEFQENNEAVRVTLDEYDSTGNMTSGIGVWNTGHIIDKPS